MQYILEVELEFPHKIHDCDDKYPDAPELINSKIKMLSAKHRQLRRKYYGAATSCSCKLICSLLPKTKYVVHSENLKFYLERKMKMTKVYRGINSTTGEYLKVVSLLILVQFISIHLFLCVV